MPFLSRELFLILFHSLSSPLSLFLRSRKDSLESESSAAIVPHELVRTRQLESVHLKFNQESGTLLPLCLRYRTILSPTPIHNIYSFRMSLKQTNKKKIVQTFALDGCGSMSNNCTLMSLKSVRKMSRKCDMNKVTIIHLLLVTSYLKDMDCVPLYLSGIFCVNVCCFYLFPDPRPNRKVGKGYFSMLTPQLTFCVRGRGLQGVKSENAV